MNIETTLLFVLAAVAVVVVVHWLEERTGLPAAALLTVAGIVYALLPGPNVTLDPHLVLTVVLPPLLYSAALDSRLLAIRRNLRTVVSLSVAAGAGHRVLVGVGFGLFVAGATAGGRHRARRRGRAAGPGRRAVGGTAGRPAAAADHPHPGRGPAQRRDRADHAQRRGGGGDAAAGFSAWSALGQFVLAAVGGVAGRAWRSRTSVRLLRRWRGDPLIAERGLAGHARSPPTWSARSCTSRACSRSWSPA